MRQDSSSGTGSETLSFVSVSETATSEIGRRLGSAARPGDVIALSGGLGAGKTRLAQGIARGLDVTGTVPSPTFNLMLVHPGTSTLYHFDLYRLERPDQLEDIDFWGTLEAGGVSVIEWADRFPGELPDDRLDVHLEAVDEHSRRIVLTARGARARELARACGEGADTG
jgi:tRNA threonylcarbamoyladenosine biosynthesis protein TsaE